MAAPQTGLTSCQIGDMGHPRTVHGNPRHIPMYKVKNRGGNYLLCLNGSYTPHFYIESNSLLLLERVWIRDYICTGTRHAALVELA